MYVFLTFLFALVACWTCSLGKNLKKMKKVMSRENMRVWSKQECGGFWAALLCCCAAFWLIYIDTNDFEVACKDNLCFQTKLAVVHKMGFFGFAPKYFRSHVESFRFDSSDYVYAISESTCTVNKRTKTRYDVVLQQVADFSLGLPPVPHIPEKVKIVKTFCNDPDGAEELRTKLYSCTSMQGHNCYYKIESGEADSEIAFEALAKLELKPTRRDEQLVIVDDSLIHGTVRAFKQSLPKLHYWGEADPEKAAIVQIRECKPQTIHVSNHGEMVYLVSSRLCRPQDVPDHYLEDKHAPNPYKVRKQIHLLQLSLTTMNHIVTELVNQGVYPLGILPLLPSFTKQAKFVTKYRQQPQKVDRSQPGIEEDSEDSGMEDEAMEDA